MNEQRSKRSGLLFPLIITLTFPVVILGFWLLSGGTLPAQALMVMIGAFAMSLAWMFMGLNERTVSAEAGIAGYTEVARELAIAGHALLEPVYAIGPSAGAVSFVVTDASGICPRGFQVNDVFSANEEGGLSRPLCKAAVGVLEALAKDAEGGNGFTPQVSCICPVGDRHVTFELRTKALTTTN